MSVMCMRNDERIARMNVVGSRIAAGRADAGMIPHVARAVKERYETLVGMAKLDKEELRRRRDKELRWKTGKDEPLRDKLHREAKEADGALAKMRRKVFESCAHARTAMMEGIIKPLAMKISGPGKSDEPEYGTGTPSQRPEGQ